MRRIILLALALLGSCGGGGGGSGGGAATTDLYVRNATSASTVTGAAWWPFRLQGVGEDDWNWTDWTADPLLPGETRFLATIPVEAQGYDLAYDLNGTSSGASMYGACVPEGVAHLEVTDGFPEEPCDTP